MRYSDFIWVFPNCDELSSRITEGYTAAKRKKLTVGSINVRTNHCHIVLEAGTTPPKRVAAQLKATASRRLRQKENWPDDRKIWTESASGRYLFDRRALDVAIRYVDEQ